MLWFPNDGRYRGEIRTLMTPLILMTSYENDLSHDLLDIFELKRSHFPEKVNFLVWDSLFQASS